MAWIPYESRSSALQQAIQAKIVGTESTPQNFYNENELGMLDDAALATWLSADPVDQEFTAEQTFSQQNASQPSIPQRQEDLYIVETLGWLMENAKTLEDKVIARKQYRILLFDLWRKHMAKTGETWYPPLRNDLWDRYQLKAGIIRD